MYLYGRFPPKTDASIGGRLKKRYKSSWRRERRDSRGGYVSWPGITRYGVNNREQQFNRTVNTNEAYSAPADMASNSECKNAYGGYINEPTEHQQTFVSSSVANPPTRAFPNSLLFPMNSLFMFFYSMCNRADANQSQNANFPIGQIQLSMPNESWHRGGHNSSCRAVPSELQTINFPFHSIQFSTQFVQLPIPPQNLSPVTNGSTTTCI